MPTGLTLKVLAAVCVVSACDAPSRQPQTPARAEPGAQAPPTVRPAAAAVTLPAPLAAASVWSVDKAASRLSFRARLGGAPVDGVFKAWDAQIAFDPKNLRASHAMLAVETPSALTGEPTRDELLPTANWLSTRRYPQATLVTRSIVQTGAGRYVASADLHLRGLARRVSVPFTLAIAHDVGRMQATLVVDRLAFGIGQVPGMPLTALDPKVQVSLNLVAKKGR